MGNIFSIVENGLPVPSAQDAYAESMKNVNLNMKLDQQINNTRNDLIRQELYDRAYEDCKARIMVAMISGHTSTLCLNIGEDNRRSLIRLGYNLNYDTYPNKQYYKVHVDWRHASIKS